MACLFFGLAKLSKEGKNLAEKFSCTYIHEKTLKAFYVPFKYITLQTNVISRKSALKKIRIKRPGGLNLIYRKVLSLKKFFFMTEND